MDPVKKLASDIAITATEVGSSEELRSWRQNLLSYFWDSDQHLKSPQERKLVQKLDLGILLCSTLGWWMKYIDQSNLTNAYVSGMKEDLHITGNEYTYMIMCYTIAFAIMQIPSNMIALKIKPRIIIVICELGWTIFTFAQAAATSSQQMYAFRFLIGSFGLATSGFLQAAIHSALDGRYGIAGWRWMYIICGSMSLPVAVSVWFLLPDYPENTQIWYLTEEDKKLALHRGEKERKAQITGKLDFKLAKRMLGSWRWWFLCVIYIAYGNSCYGNNVFATYLKAQGYSVTMSNIIPSLACLITIVTEVMYGYFSDLTGNRVYWMIGPIMATTVVGSSILIGWTNSEPARLFAFFLLGCGYVTNITWTWANEVNIGNAEERALTISSMNGLYYAVNAFLPLYTFPQTTAPKFERGFPSTLAFALATVTLLLIADYLHKRQLRQEEEAQAINDLLEA